MRHPRLCTKEAAGLWVRQGVYGSLFSSLTCASTLHLRVWGGLRRSMFAEDFKDARGFGWHIEGKPAHDWGTLLSKKARRRLPCTLLT